MTAYPAFRPSAQSGLTLIELLLVVAVLAVLTAIALPAYNSYRDRVNQSLAAQDILVLQALIKNHQSNHGVYPASLAEVGNAGKLDPWGRAYIYLELSSPANKGSARKDRKLNPINSDFDLYSLGKNGVSRAQLTNKESLDDVVRANDGAFVGVAADFTR